MYLGLVVVYVRDEKLMMWQPLPKTQCEVDPN